MGTQWRELNVQGPEGPRESGCVWGAVAVRRRPGAPRRPAPLVLILAGVGEQPIPSGRLCCTTHSRALFVFGAPETGSDHPFSWPSTPFHPTTLHPVWHMPASPLRAWSCKRDSFLVCFSPLVWFLLSGCCASPRAAPPPPVAGCPSGSELRFLTAFCSNPGSRFCQRAGKSLYLSELQAPCSATEEPQQLLSPGDLWRLNLEPKAPAWCLTGVRVLTSVSCPSFAYGPHSRESTCSGVQ